MKNYPNYYCGRPLTKLRLALAGDETGRIDVMADILGKRDASVPQTPTRVSEPSRLSQLPKRFFKDVSVKQEQDRHVIKLDDKPVRTPSQALLASHSCEVAQMIAEEWRQQGERIDPTSMPVTRLANTAIDGVSTDMQAVKEDIVRFASSDLLCYRADGPEALIQLQSQIWDPWIDWAQTALGAQLCIGRGCHVYRAVS